MALQAKGRREPARLGHAGEPLLEVGDGGLFSKMLVVSCLLPVFLLIMFLCLLYVYVCLSCCLFMLKMLVVLLAASPYLCVRVSVLVCMLVVVCFSCLFLLGRRWQPPATGFVYCLYIVYVISYLLFIRCRKQNNIYTHVYVYTYICIHICIYIHMYIHIYIYIYIAVV